MNNSCISAAQGLGWRTEGSYAEVLLSSPSVPPLPPLLSPHDKTGGIRQPPGSLRARTGTNWAGLGSHGQARAGDRTQVLSNNDVATSTRINASLPGLADLAGRPRKRRKKAFFVA